MPWYGPGSAAHSRRAVKEQANPRPTNGMVLAITVMNKTLASSGRLAM
jgi:hypothetical protein